MKIIRFIFFIFSIKQGKCFLIFNFLYFLYLERRYSIFLFVHDLDSIKISKNSEFKYFLKLILIFAHEEDCLR